MKMHPPPPCTSPAVGRGFAQPTAILFVGIYIKNGEKGLKNASVLVITIPPPPLPSANLFVGGKQWI